MSNGTNTTNSSERFPRGPFDLLIEKTTQFMMEQGFKTSSIKRYQVCWRKFAAFCNEKYGVDSFSVENSLAFLDSQGIHPDHPRCPRIGHLHTMQPAIRMMTELVLHGSFSRYPSRSRSVVLPESLKDALDGYINHLRTEGGHPTTVEGHQSLTRQFLLFLADRRVATVKDIQARHISEYLTSRIHLTRVTLNGHAWKISKFLKYLYLEGRHPTDLSKVVPQIPRGQGSTLPLIWTPEEVNRILGAVDVASPCGKRNYAMLLLAVRLGMRVGDIKGLKIDNLEWEKNRITIRQSKTKELLELPLTEEIGAAIIDYLKNGRPETNHREVFISANAPYGPLGESYHLFDALARYRHRAGIPRRQEGRAGMHSLRHTLASRLLEAGTPMPSISNILGHVSIESTKRYIRIDIEALRRTALDIEEA